MTINQRTANDIQSALSDDWENIEFASIVMFDGSLKFPPTFTALFVEDIDKTVENLKVKSGCE
jgi:hypothetical protein